VDDKRYIMERAIQVSRQAQPLQYLDLTRQQLASSLPITSRNGSALTDALRSQLWKDLKHPPLSFVLSEYPIVSTAI
jgi:hypothetical protein